MFFCAALDFADITCQSKHCTRGQLCAVFSLAGLLMNFNVLGRVPLRVHYCFKYPRFIAPNRGFHEHVGSSALLKSTMAAAMKGGGFKSSTAIAGSRRLTAFLWVTASAEGCVREISDTFSYALQSATGMRIRSRYAVVVASCN